MALFRALALRRLEEELMDFTLAEVFDKMRLSDSDFEDWLRTIALLGTPRYGSCRRPMKLRREDNMWICHLRRTWDRSQYGVGHVVEIDDTCVTKRKYNRGRWVRKHQWLFGGYERGSGRSFLILVRRRDARTLLRLIVKYIRPGTTMISDCWRAYSRISTLPQGFTHLTVNHQLNFIDPRSGAHTQNIDC
ncbi:hypothetical protein ANCCAN_12461 [Ancylostoma caninum]|uniref:ISXO2-like transposase domain-containing protein n=1 Tax=Ancylostoma caninum TaxID=29170 RepID=A0A368GB03_ANCCA|nr:hypothetical protein ANCCAN_12461 [Ancylostoma caninum]